MIDLTLIALPKPYLRSPNSQINLGIAYIAGAVRHAGLDVKIENFGLETDKEAVLKLEKSLLFGISITAMEILHANRFAKELKDIFPESFVFVGGPGTLAHKSINTNYIDSVFFEEAENTIFEVIEDAKSGKIKPFYHGKMVEDLDSLSFFPARDLYKNNNGGRIFANDDEGKSTLIISSRGCVGRCNFCSSPALANGKIRFRSPKKVAEEIIHIKDNFGITKLKFADDMFSASPKRVKELCVAIRPLNIKFRISARVKPFTDKMAEDLKSAGCEEIGFGIENGSDKILKILNKNATVQDNLKALEIAHNHEITTRSLCMVRLPGQNKETIEENKRFFEKAKIDISTLTSFVPLPGSEFYNNPDKYEIELLDFDLDDLNFYFYGNNGRNPLKPIFKQKNRSLESFMKESEDFRDWFEKHIRVNKG